VVIAGCQLTAHIFIVLYGEKDDCKSCKKSKSRAEDREKGKKKGSQVEGQV